MKRQTESAGMPPTALTENVLKFPAIASRLNRLTTLDRQQAELWISGPPSEWCTIAVHADPNEADEIGDFISIYRINEHWASWGIARRGDAIILWEARQGKDLGVFSTILAALHAIWPLVYDPLSSLRESTKHHKRNR